MNHLVRPLYEPLPIDPAPLITLIDQWYLQETVQASLTLAIFQLLTIPKTANQLVAETDWHPETTIRLLNLLCQLGCLELTAAGYRNTPLAATYLTPASFLYYGGKYCEPLEAGSFGADLIRCLRQEPDTHISPEPSWTPDRLKQMGVFALDGFIQQTVKHIDLSQATRLLDLGGGHGFYSIAFAQKYPHLQVTLFDLPVITELAGQFITEFRLDDQITLLAGNFLLDPIGEGYDTVLCSNILHRDKRDLVLPKVYSALRPGGMLILRCRIADCPDNLSTALSKLYWQVRGGKDLYTLDDWKGFVAKHGFTGFTLHTVDDIFATITAWRE